MKNKYANYSKARLVTIIQEKDQQIQNLLDRLEEIRRIHPNVD